MNARGFLLGAVILTASVPTLADITEGRTANDRPFVSGGIGIGEVEQLKQIADKYSLQLVVSSRAGAYLADLHGLITNANGQKVLDTQLNAPWLMVDLTPGTYTVVVTHQSGPAQRRSVTIVPGKREQMVMQFDVSADTAKNPAPAR